MRLTNQNREPALAKSLHGPEGGALKLATTTADKKEDPSQLRERDACRSFEGFMLGELLKQMRQAEGSDGGILPRSRAEKMFANQQCEALADLLASREPLGLADLIRSSIGSTGGGSLEDRKHPNQPDKPTAVIESPKPSGTDADGG